MHICIYVKGKHNKIMQKSHRQHSCTNERTDNCRYKRSPPLDRRTILARRKQSRQSKATHRSYKEPNKHEKLQNLNCKKLKFLNLFKKNRKNIPKFYFQTNRTFKQQLTSLTSAASSSSYGVRPHPQATIQLIPHKHFRP